ncbi:exonuclease SbcC [Planoprotostelium fungivorum]|uniref:Exonuclease SbcC n=1 Tax=Planoprotostelium fungivorum TaxID=1890364 RepID=A0A2P6MSD0_9EUKA|nr:exonuclease SbcC [Planoprotostelium fungivorum]
MDYDLVKTFPVKRTEPKAFDELPVSKLLNYLTRDNIIELIGFTNFSSLNVQVRQQTGKVSLPAVKKMLADNEQFQATLDQNHGMMQQAYNKYLAANEKANELTRQQQSKQVNWLMSKPKKQFLGGVAKHTPPEVYQKCVEQYDDPDAKYEQYKIIPYSGLRNSAYEKELNAGHTNRAAVLRPSWNEDTAPAQSTISRLVKKETGPDARDRIRRRILQAAENTNTKIRGKKCDLNEESENLKGLFERELTTYNNKKQCMKMNNKRYEERLQELLEEKEKEYEAEVKRVQVECTTYYDVIIQLPQSIRGKKCDLNEESENLKGLFEKELTTYNNKKQCMKMNNKRYEERLQELLEEKEKEYAAEVKRVQVECTSKTMSLELQLEEMFKTIEQKDTFITKQKSR